MPSPQSLTWWVVAAAVLALALLVARGLPGGTIPRAVEHDPYANLPLAPPRMADAGTQDAVNTAFKIRSNCWDVNNWARVTVPKIAEAEASGQLLDPYAAEGKMVRSLQAVRRCPPGSYVEMEGGERVPVSSLLASAQNNV